MAPPIIEVKDLRVAFGGHPVLDGIGFLVEPGRFVGVIGPNGAGKSTLLRVLLGLLPGYEGEVRVFGRPPAQLGPERHRIGYVAQRRQSNLRFPASALDVVAMRQASDPAPLWGLWRGRSRGRQRETALASLRRVGMEAVADRPFGELSGGQQQRVLLARALCHHAELLVLDEPETGLDLPAQNQFYQLLKQLQAAGLTVLMVSHDLAALRSYADEVLCIDRTAHVHRLRGDAAEELSTACEWTALTGRSAAGGAQAAPAAPGAPARPVAQRA